MTASVPSRQPGPLSANAAAGLSPPGVLPPGAPPPGVLPPGAPHALGANHQAGRFEWKKWRWRRGWSRILLATQFFVAALLLCRELGWLQSAELAAYDRLVVAWSHGGISDRVVLVTVTEADIADHGWPLRDGDLAALLTKLTDAGARAVAVDLYRDRPLPPGDEVLSALRARHPEIIWARKLADKGNNGVAAPVVASAGQSALVDVVTDPGGVVRRGLLAAEDSSTGRTIPTLGARLAQRYMGQGFRQPDDTSLTIGGGRIVLLSDQWGPYATIDAAGYQTMLDFFGGTGRFHRFSLAQIMQGESVTNQARDPVAEQPRDRVADQVRDRIVLVGVDALSVPDRVETPFSTNLEGALPGVMLHAYMADQLIRIANGEATSRIPLPRGVEAGIIWACAMAAALLVLLVGSVGTVFLAMLTGIGLISGIVYVAFGHGLILPGIPAAIAWTGAAIGDVWVLHGVGIRDRLRLRRSFEHYLDPRIIQNLVEDDNLPEFGGEHREITAMFTDVAGFTAFSESMPPERVAALLHDYFDGVTMVIMECGGLISDFLGDGLLALFGAPQPQNDHADRAVRAALRIDAFASRFRTEQQALGIDWGATRIGVHSGMAMVGNIGTRNRLKYGAIGDVLNTASRVEGLNKRIGTRIAVSGDTVARCTQYLFWPVGDFVVLGRRAALSVFTPLTPVQLDDEEGIKRYERACEALRDRRPEADAWFKALRRDYPEDPCIAFHCARLAAGETGFEVVMSEK
jgi:adenylate cyclase